MLINCNNSSITRHVKFVSYTGRWPHLCSGVLTLEIDGEEITFGYGVYPKDEPKYYPFWSSGGGINPNYEGTWKENGESTQTRFPNSSVNMQRKLTKRSMLMLSGDVVEDVFKTIQN